MDLSGVQLGVDAKSRRELRRVERFPALRFQRIGERADAGGIQRDARRVLVAAELRQVVRATGQRVVEVKALHAAPGPLRDAALLGNDQRGPVEPFHQPRRDDSDHTDVPPRRRHRPRPPLLRRSELFRMRDGLARDPRLELLPLGVGAVELFGEEARFAQVLAEQQPDADGRVVEPSRGVDPRTQLEPDIAGGHLAGELRHRLEGQHTDAAAPRQLLEPEVHQHPVRSGERHHVGDGAERHQIEHLAQVRLRSRREPSRLSQPLAQRQQQVEGDADRGQLAARKRASRLVRIENGDRARQILRRGVVIDHHHVEAEASGGVHLRHRRDAAVGAHHQARTAGGDLRQRLRVQAVSFDQPLRDVEVDLAAQLAQHGNQQRRAGHAVDVIVAVDADGLALQKRALKA